MKPSGIALLALGGIVAGAVVVTAVATKVTLGQGSQADGREGAPAPRDPGELTMVRHELSGFDGISIEGSWTAVVRRGDEWRVDLTYPENDVGAIDVSVRGERLRLGGARPGSLFKRTGGRLTADIEMPALATLEAAGENRLTISGFEGERLTIEGAGVTNLTGEGCRYDELELSLAGAGNAQLEGIVVTDADVEVAGATSVSLTMDGGELTGALAGAGKIEYFGTVSREAVDVAGFGRIGPAEP